MLPAVPPLDAAHRRGQRDVSCGFRLFYGSLADRIRRSSSAGLTASAAAAAAADCDDISQSLEENESLKAAGELFVAAALT
jgi:hypothetical protein